MHNTIIKFANNMTGFCLITDKDEAAYREKVRDLAVWCQDNNLSLNVSKTEELIVDYRKWRAEYTLIHIYRAVVEQVESFKFLGDHITEELSWSTDQHRHEEGMTMPLPPQQAETIWHGPSDL
jgi:hypothetical protein